jgi:hypothetical protein
MDQLIDDLLHAQPDVLFIIAGLVLVLIGVVGSIKTYIDPGKNGRIAALAIGIILLVVGSILYTKQPPSGGGTPPPSAQANPAQTAPAGQSAQTAAQTSAQPTTQTTRACRFTSGPDTGQTRRFPRAKPFLVGAPCYNLKGDHGLGVPEAQ